MRGSMIRQNIHQFSGLTFDIHVFFAAIKIYIYSNMSDTEIYLQRLQINLFRCAPIFLPGYFITPKANDVWFPYVHTYDLQKDVSRCYYPGKSFKVNTVTAL